MKHQSL